jgi:hypothetical protein
MIFPPGLLKSGFLHPALFAYTLLADISLAKAPHNYVWANQVETVSDLINQIHPA